jgi:protease I
MIRRISLFALSLLFCCNLWAQEKIVMVIAHQGFRDEELTKPLKYFKDQGFSVDIASTALSTAQGMLGMRVDPDLIIEEIKLEDYKALVIIGGIGAKSLWNSGALAYKIKEADGNQQVVAAICLAPIALAKAGILKGRRATVWPQESERLIGYGVEYVFEDVVVDGVNGTIITASGPGAALSFGRKIVEAIRR